MFKMFYLLWMISILLLDVNADQPEQFSKKLRTISVSDSRFLTTHRTLPWCITGNDEPEFQRYPFSEFKPFLDKTITRTKMPDNNLVRYFIELKKVKIGRADLTGKNGGELYNTAHFTISSKIRQEFSKGVLSETVDYDMEGLIVQVSYAPYGVGLPTGTWLPHADLPCTDCIHIHGRPVGCKKRTWINFMHPTILVFHHKMNKTKHETETEIKRIEDTYLQKYCLEDLIDPNNTNPNSRNQAKQDLITANQPPATEPPGPTGRQSGGGQEPAAAAAQPFRLKCETDSFCKTPPAPVNTTNLLKCLTPIFSKVCGTGSTKPDKTGTACVSDTDCNEDASSNSEGGGKCEPESPIGKDGDDFEVPPINPYVGKQSEIHSNLVWFTHPCHDTRVIKFTILAVHSFSKGIFFAFHDEKRYNLPKVDFTDEYSPPFVPSPVFSGFPHTCENNGPVDFTLVKENLGTEYFQFSKSYDQCVVTERLAEKQICKKAPIAKKLTPPPACVGSLVTTKDLTSLCKSNVYGRMCPLCPQPASTTIPPITPATEIPLVKRGFHGGINFITNFAIMPVTVFIARFYKETFNVGGFKGAKLWYWLHLFGSGGSSVLMYFGYFSKTFVEDDDQHVIYGNIYIMVLAFAYISAWARHKNWKVTAVAESVHALCGYACFVLAILCMITIPGGETPGTKTIYVLIICSCSILGIFYVAMTCYMCSLDKRFGMQPKRRHFPTVEVRFDAIPVPGDKGRKIILAIISIMVFGLTTATIFF